MIQKEIKYNLHYHDVRGDFLRPPHGTTPATVLQVLFHVWLYDIYDISYFTE